MARKRPSFLQAKRFRASPRSTAPAPAVATGRIMGSLAGLGGLAGMGGIAGKSGGLAG